MRLNWKFLNISIHISMCTEERGINFHWSALYINVISGHWYHEVGTVVINRKRHRRQEIRRLKTSSAYIPHNVINMIWQMRLPISQKVQRIPSWELVTSSEYTAHISTISYQEMYNVYFSDFFFIIYQWANYCYYGLFFSLNIDI